MSKLAAASCCDSRALGEQDEVLVILRTSSYLAPEADFISFLTSRLRSTRLASSLGRIPCGSPSSGYSGSVSSSYKVFTKRLLHVRDCSINFATNLKLLVIVVTFSLSCLTVVKQMLYS